MKLKDAYSLEESHDKPRQLIKKQRYPFANKSPYSQNYGFSSSYVQMWELTIRKAECWRTDAFILWCRRRFESPWYSKEIKPVNPKEDQFGIFIGRTDAETEAPVFCPPDTKSWLIEINPDGGKNFLSCWRRGWQKMRWLVGITDSADMNLSKLQEIEDRADVLNSMEL